MIYKGKGGVTRELLDNRLGIRRSGFGSFLIHGLVGEKTIYYNQISAVQFKVRSKITAGYIQFTLSGGVESKKGIREAVKDENTVMFCDNEPFEEARQFVEGRLGHSGASAPVARETPVDMLDKLASLLERGHITPDEFADQIIARAVVERARTVQHTASSRQTFGRRGSST